MPDNLALSSTDQFEILVQGNLHQRCIDTP